MALRKSHGAQKGTGYRIEVLPADELPEPVPAQPAQLARREDGTIADSEAAKELGRRGGEARAQKKKLLQGMGLAKVAEDNTFNPYYKAAQAWLDATVAIYAAMCGGALGPGPSALLGNAAICLAYARQLADRGATQQDELIARQSIRYMDSMKQQMLAAYELGVKEAKMRSDLNEGSAIDAFEAALRKQQEESEDGSGG